MKKSHYLLVVLLVSAGAISCATTPSQDSDFEVYGEVPEGPGIFSGDSGEISLLKNSEASSATGQVDDVTPEPAPELSEQDWQEFSAFKRWLKSKQSGGPDYIEFQQWLKYEQYRKWQDSL